MTPEQMLREFHAAAGLVLPPGPTLEIPDGFTMADERQRMLLEEAGELADAVAAGDLVAIADACADVVYVAIGTAVTYGLPFDKILAEVHRSNMTKVAGGPVINEAGKIVKGPGYEPPRIAELLAPGDEPPVPSSDWPAVSHYARGPVEIIRTGDELDVYTSVYLRAAVTDLTGAGWWHLVIDMTATAYMDTTGLAALAGALRRVRAHDGTLSIVCTNPLILRVFTITGLDRVFTIRDTVDSAVAAAAEAADA
jgi:anti-sigma B factor antagonist